MTDEQINAAITEAIDADPHWKCAKDYCTDLNAMHEAEKVFDCPELYDGNLIKVCEGVQYMWHATARQRAEAFLRTLGKWEEATDKDSLTVQTATTEQSSVDQKEVQP